MAGKKVWGAQRGIHKRNFIYYNIYPYVRMFFFHFYGKVQVKGLENIPKGQPVIFAPNHQNALMDALIVLFASPQDVVFLARADIFKSRFTAFFFNSLKILPVFRQRDGATELGKNEEIFDISVNLLKNRHHMCVMPEGNHGHQRKLRAFGKGIFRIAFTAQEDYGTEPFVKIIPVGIDMGDYVKQNASLFLNFGEPMEMSDYWNLYQESPPRALNAAKKDLIDNLKPLMIHIETDQYYEVVMSLREIFNDTMRAEIGMEGSLLHDRFRADKAMIARLDAVIAGEEEAAQATSQEPSPAPPSRIKPLAEKVERYTAGVKKLNIRDWVVRDKGFGVIRSLGRYAWLIPTFPFFLYGYLTNIIPFWLPVHLSRNIKDRQFHSSIKAGLGILVIFPLFYFIMTLLVMIFTGPWWIPLLFLVTLFPMGKFALRWYFWWKKTVRGSWFNRRLRHGDAEAVALVKLREEIIEMTREIIRH
ncbi:MAG: 1-acyl-sn-glycerol-3-phosphate acyltransferase [Bacteroidales bacterium]